MTKKYLLSFLFLTISYFSVSQIDTLIIECPLNHKNSLKAELLYLQTEWENTPNTLILIYKGNDIGDYFHLNFEDESGNNYDFGSGENNYSDYQLHEKKWALIMIIQLI